ncbi:MAG TPA: hypothetical protein VG146_02985 [Verrucomicrobiae bacterium]|nr:hypothetical protein [Verrucomicrobiae bacterium]
MKHPDDLTEAELDALDANNPKMTRKFRDDLTREAYKTIRVPKSKFLSISIFPAREERVKGEDCFKKTGAM